MAMADQRTARPETPSPNSENRQDDFAPPFEGCLTYGAMTAFTLLFTAVYYHGAQSGENKEVNAIAPEHQPAFSFEDMAHTSLPPNWREEMRTPAEAVGLEETPSKSTAPPVLRCEVEQREDGSKLIRTHIGELPHGPWILVGQDGAIISNQTYNCGKPVGVGFHIMPKEQGMLEFDYSIKPDGFTLRHTKDDQLLKSEEWTFGTSGSSDVRNGISQTWFPNGKLSSFGHYSNNKREGQWYFYNQDGSIDPEYSGTYKNGALITPHQEK